MSIGFVVLIWIVFFTVLATSYIFLRFLAKEYYFAEVLKDVFLAFAGVLVILFALLFVTAIGGVVLDYFFPARIFTKNFGFEPTADVRIIEGSSFWTPFRLFNTLEI